MALHLSQTKCFIAHDNCIQCIDFSCPSSTPLTTHLPHSIVDLWNPLPGQLAAITRDGNIYLWTDLTLSDAKIVYSLGSEVSCFSHHPQLTQLVAM